VTSPGQRNLKSVSGPVSKENLASSGYSEADLERHGIKKYSDDDDDDGLLSY